MNSMTDSDTAKEKTREDIAQVQAGEVPSLSRLRLFRRTPSIFRAIPFRLRLTLLYTSLFALALLAIGVGVHFAVAQALYAGVQRDLTAATQQVRAILSAVGFQSIRTASGELQVYLNRDFIQLFTNRNIGAQFFDGSGSLLTSTPNLEPYMLPLPPEAFRLTAKNIKGIIVEHNKKKKKRIKKK